MCSMYLFCPFIYHDHSSCSLLKRMRKKRKKNITETFDYRHWSQFKLLKLSEYYPLIGDSILFLAEIRSTADRLISDSVLNLNN